MKLRKFYQLGIGLLFTQQNLCSPKNVVQILLKMLLKKMCEY